MDVCEEVVLTSRGRADWRIGERATGEPCKSFGSRYHYASGHIDDITDLDQRRRFGRIGNRASSMGQRNLLRLGARIDDLVDSLGSIERGQQHHRGDGHRFVEELYHFERDGSVSGAQRAAGEPGSSCTESAYAQSTPEPGYDSAFLNHSLACHEQLRHNGVVSRGCRQRH